MKSKLWIVICALIVVLAACGQDANHSSNNKDTENIIELFRSFLVTQKFYIA